MSRLDRILQGGLYRSRNGILLGVCRGTAEYFNFSVFWVRAIALVLLIFTGFWPVGALYILAALVIKPEPVIPLESEDEREFYESYMYSGTGAVHRLKRRYKNLEQRIRRMESAVTDREFDWDERLNGNY